MYDPEEDVAEIPLSYGELDEPVEALSIELTEQGEGGLLTIAWGSVELTAAFSID